MEKLQELRISKNYEQSEQINIKRVLFPHDGERYEKITTQPAKHAKHAKKDEEERLLLFIIHVGFQYFRVFRVFRGQIPG